VPDAGSPSEAVEIVTATVTPENAVPTGWFQLAYAGLLPEPTSQKPVADPLRLITVAE
jgi:hypothetical protein